MLRAISLGACALVVGLFSCAITARGDTIQTFDGGGSAYVSQQYGFPPPGTVLPGGPSGSFYRIATTTGTQANAIAFSSIQAPGDLTASFDFRFANGGGDFGLTEADGVGFVLLNTAFYGSTGTPAAFISEEANATGSLGIGIDTYNNGIVDANSNNRISLHYNNLLLGNFAPGFELNNGVFNRLTLTTNFAAGTVSLQIIQNVFGASTTHNVFTNQNVAGLTAYQNRAYLSGRTGSAWQNHDLDNISITTAAPVPLPRSAWAGLALCGVVGAWNYHRRLTTPLVR